MLDILLLCVLVLVIIKIKKEKGGNQMDNNIPIIKKLIKVGNGTGVLLDRFIQLNSGIHLGDRVRIFVEEDTIILKKVK